MAELEAQLRAYGRVLDRAGGVITDVADTPRRRVHRSYFVAVAAGIAVALAASAITLAVRPGGSRHPDVVSPAPSVPSSGPPSTPTVAPGVLAVGDSVMLGAVGALASAIPGIVVDAGLSRQVDDAVPILDSDLANAHAVGTVVVDLGTNGPTTAADLDAIVRAAGHREVFFVTLRVPRVWELPDNTLLRALPQRWPNAHVIDWHEYANAHDDWFLSDGFHMTATGQRAFAALIAGELGPTPRTPVTGAPPATASP